MGVHFVSYFRAFDTTYKNGVNYLKARTRRNTSYIKGENAVPLSLLI